MSMTTAPKSYFTAINALRGICSFIVILFHAEEVKNARFLADHPFHLLPASYLVVDFFFVISGFIITHLYYDKFQQLNVKQYWDFIYNRFIRIYPVHLATLGILIVLELIHLMTFHPQPNVNPPFTESFSLFSLVTNLLLVHAWHIHPYLTWNFPAWSISGEWFAYLLAPFTIPLLMKWFNTPVKALICYGAAGALYGVLGHTLGTYDVTYDFGAIRTLLGFVMGINLYTLYLYFRDRSHAIHYDHWFLGLLIAIFALSFVHTPTVLLILLNPFLVLFCTLSNGWLNRLLSKKPLFYLGEISYSIYMTHGIVISVFFNILSKVRPHPSHLELSIATVLLFGLCVFAAHILFTWVEDPARRFFKNRHTPRHVQIQTKPAVSAEPAGQAQQRLTPISLNTV